VIFDQGDESGFKPTGFDLSENVDTDTEAGEGIVSGGPRRKKKEERKKNPLRIMN